MVADRRDQCSIGLDDVLLTSRRELWLIHDGPQYREGNIDYYDAGAGKMERGEIFKIQKLNNNNNNNNNKRTTQKVGLSPSFLI